MPSVPASQATPNLSHAGGLSPAQVSQFRKDGYLLPQQQLLPAAELTALRDTFEELLSEHIAEGGRPEHMDVPHFRHPELMRWLMHPDVLDVVESLIGPDIIAFSSHFICKPPHTGRRVPWHEDSAYWKGQWDPMDVVTIWLAIDPSTPDNGNMQVIPGSHSSHTKGYSDYEPVTGEPEVFAARIKPGSFDESKAVHCTLKPGEYSLHHAKMIHGSEPNLSAYRRCGYTMRFISAKSHFNAANNSHNEFQIYLARGTDHAGNTFGDPTQQNHAWLNNFASRAEEPKGH